MNDHDDHPTTPAHEVDADLAAPGREFLAAYRALDEPDRVLLWCALLEEFDRCSTARPDEDEAPASRPEIPSCARGGRVWQDPRL